MAIIAAAVFALLVIIGTWIHHASRKDK